ncbi:MAG: hypothetical protein ACRBFS_04400 [Aureispira sp.]
MKGLLFCAIALFSLSACQQLDKLTQFDVPYTTTFTVPATPLTGLGLPIDIMTPAIQNDNQQTYQSYNTAANMIDEVSLKELELTILTPTGANFSFLEKAEVFISADGLPEVSLASKNPIPAGAASPLTFDVSGANLKDYIKADNFTLRVNTVVDEVITVDHEIQVRTVFSVDAKILGL